jgi:MFS family permease
LGINNNFTDTIGYGRFQYGILAATGLAFMTDAMEIMLLSFLQVQVSFVTTDNNSSLLTSIVFIGSFFGSILLGPASDYYGRRTIFLLSTGCFLCLFSIGTTFCTTYTSLLLCRFMVGIGIGTLTIPNDIWIEFLPSSKRGTNMLYTGYFWTIGTIAVPALAYIIHVTMDTNVNVDNNNDNNSDWRVLVFICSIPCIISTIIGYLYIPESPRWLLSRHYRMYTSQDIITVDSYYHKEALRILRHAATINGKNKSNNNTVQQGNQYQQLTNEADYLDDNSYESNNTTNTDTNDDSSRLLLFNTNVQLVIETSTSGRHSVTNDRIILHNESAGINNNNDIIFNNQTDTTTIIRRNSTSRTTDTTTVTTSNNYTRSIIGSISRNNIHSSIVNPSVEIISSLSPPASTTTTTITTTLYNEWIRSIRILFSKEHYKNIIFISCLWILYPILYYGTILVTTTVIFYNINNKTDPNTNTNSYSSSSSSFNYSAIFMTSLAEVFGLTILFYTIDNVGRIRCQVVSYILGGLSMFILCLYDSHYHNISERNTTPTSSSSVSYILTIWAFVARMCYKVAVCTTWITTSELLPTSIRGTGHGLVNSLARLSAAASPFIVHTKNNNNNGSSIQSIGWILLLVSIATSIIVQQLPESKGRRLQ